MSGFSGPWCCFRCFFLFGSTLSTSDVGLRWLKKNVPETWLDWRNYKDSPLKGQIQQQGQVKRSRRFHRFPLLEVGARWQLAFHLLETSREMAGGCVGIGWIFAKLLWGEAIWNPFKMNRWFRFSTVKQRCLGAKNLGVMQKSAHNWERFGATGQVSKHIKAPVHTEQGAHHDRRGLGSRVRLPWKFLGYSSKWHIPWQL